MTDYETVMKIIRAYKTGEIHKVFERVAKQAISDNFGILLSKLTYAEMQVVRDFRKSGKLSMQFCEFLAQHIDLDRYIYQEFSRRDSKTFKVNADKAFRSFDLWSNEEVNKVVKNE